MVILPSRSSKDTPPFLLVCFAEDGMHLPLNFRGNRCGQVWEEIQGDPARQEGVERGNSVEVPLPCPSSSPSLHPPDATSTGNTITAS
jgi:hypothetical protein